MLWNEDNYAIFSLNIKYDSSVFSNRNACSEITLFSKCDCCWIFQSKLCNGNVKVNLIMISHLVLQLIALLSIQLNMTTKRHLLDVNQPWAYLGCWHSVKNGFQVMEYNLIEFNLKYINMLDKLEWSKEWKQSTNIVKWIKDNSNMTLKIAF